jgi:hypothetical protein
MTEVKKPEEQQVAKPPAQKKYRILSRTDYIFRCGYILPNSLQCWKAGEEEVITTDSAGEEQKYQLCERHVRIQKALDLGTLKSESVDTPLKEMTLPDPVVPVTLPTKEEEEKKIPHLVPPAREVVPPPKGEEKKEEKEGEKK